jgi:SpoVK/Ycf46/Vps4 family AAA+-type ATPase
MLELLNQLDGFEPAQNIKVLMATNRIDILDPALLRPGRIDRKIEFPNPNEAARLHIVKIHSRKMNLMRGINLKKIANAMKGASGAESKAVCTEAGMFALRERRVHVTQEDFEMAVAKVMKKDSGQSTQHRKGDLLPSACSNHGVSQIAIALWALCRQGHVAGAVLAISHLETIPLLAGCVGGMHIGSF